MPRDLSEVLDEYCEEMYGHTNWAWTNSMTKEELETSKGYRENDVFFYEEARCWDCNELESVCECKEKN